MNRVPYTSFAWVCLAVSALLPAQASARPPEVPTVIALPAGFQPEGIAIGALPLAYFGSRVDGSLYRADLTTGQGTIVSPGPGTPALGLALDARGRLFVAGGTAGTARVIDAETGAELASYRLGAAPDTFVNDVTLTPTGAWFTDSRTPVLYHLPIGPDGALPDQDSLVRLPLTGDIQYVNGAINANGIVRTPDGAALIIVQSATGQLFRVDPASGRTTRIDLGAEDVRSGDGLLWHDGDLLVVQNRLNMVAAVRLDEAARTGRIERRIRDERWDVPTTIAAFGDRLYLPNARFTTPPTATTPYNAVAVEQPR
ncbi:SMP-30/gluconolactonase/LRE family protein [Nocardia cyriacigeorgica]